MSLLDHENWKDVRGWLNIQVYDRDGGHKNPRIRIELADSAPLEIKRIALAITMPCVNCGSTIRPFRARHPPKRGEEVARHVYFAAACPLEINVGCSRGAAARDEYLAIRKAQS